MKDLEKKYCENERGKTESGRKNKATYQKKIPTATPEKYKAKCLVTAGIRNGSIVKQPCSECGDKVVDAHHPDYDKPLDIVWLCRKHHMEVHGKQLHDYSLLSEKRTERFYLGGGRCWKGWEPQRCWAPITPGRPEKSGDKRKTSTRSYY